MKAVVPNWLRVFAFTLAFGMILPYAFSQEADFAYDSILRREDDRHNTLGPTGHRLFTERIETSPGFQGVFGYCLSTPDFRNPLMIEFHGDKGELSLNKERITWFPSHLEVVWQGERIRVVEKKFITADDMMIDRVRVINTSSVPVDMEVYIFGRKTPLLERSQSKQVSVDLSEAANIVPSPGTRLFTAGPNPKIIWVKGEKPFQKAGSHLITFKAARDGCNVNLDGFFVAEEGEQPLRLEEGTSFKGEVPEQISLLPGTIEYDSVRYVIPDPGPEKRPSLVALRGGQPEDPAYNFPESTRFSVPDVQQAVALLHLLAMTPAPKGRSASGTPAFFEFFFDNESSERVPWPSVCSRLAKVSIAKGEETTAAHLTDLPERLRDRAEWRFLLLPGIREPVMQLSYTPPPGRFIRYVKVLKGKGPEVPVLLAVTFEIPPKTGRLPVLTGKPNFHGMRVFLVLAGEEFGVATFPGRKRMLLRFLHLEPGVEIAFNAVLAAGLRRFPTVLRSLDRVNDGSVFKKHVEEYRKWFEDNVPGFTCSDALMVKAWHYRWFLVRHSMLRLGLPDFSLPVFYETMHGGLIFPVTTYSTPHILSEVRWLKDRVFAQGQIRALLKQQYPNGLLPCIRIGSSGGFYTHWIPAAAFGGYEVNGSLQYLKEIMPLLIHNLEGTLEIFDRDRDFLPSPPSHVQTGMKGQPSFFYFNGYDYSGPEARVERPDFAAYVYASARALAKGFKVLEKEEEVTRLDSIADRVREAVLAKMWHETDSFFYAIREEDDTPARCKEIAGFYPFFTRLVPNEARFLKALEALVDPKEFWTPFPVATVARSVPVFSRSVQRPPGPGGGTQACVWNGATFPHAESLIAEVMANALRYYRKVAVTEEIFSQFLASYTKLHFEGGDPSRPLIRECYNGETGRGFGWPDCFQSTYNDLLVRFVAGLVPGIGEGIELWPLVKDLEHFSFRDILYHGKSLDITWDRPDGKRVYKHAPEGYTLAVDGKQIFNVAELKRMIVGKEGKLLNEPVE
jgi:hypothetical protein